LGIQLVPLTHDEFVVVAAVEMVSPGIAPSEARWTYYSYRSGLVGDASDSYLLCDPEMPWGCPSNPIELSRLDVGGPPIDHDTRSPSITAP
jgi:hypothetical protein